MSVDERFNSVYLRTIKSKAVEIGKTDECRDVVALACACAASLCRR